LTETIFDRFWAAEVYRIKGELTLAEPRVQRSASSVEKSTKAKVKSGKSKIPSTQHPTPNTQEAEACFHKAIEVARQQEAKSLELRAVISLSRLWQRQGKQTEARKMLAEIYGWFTEGFDTADLREAKALLATLT
jgi:predicted ATPase